MTTSAPKPARESAEISTELLTLPFTTTVLSKTETETISNSPFGASNSGNGWDYIQYLVKCAADVSIENAQYYADEIQKLSRQRKYISELSTATSKLKVYVQGCKDV